MFLPGCLLSVWSEMLHEVTACQQCLSFLFVPICRDRDPVVTAGRESPLVECQHGVRRDNGGQQGDT